MKVSKSTLYGFAIFLMIAGGGIFMLQESESQNITGNVVSANSGEVQEVVIGMKNYNYYPDTIKVEAGKPVKISLDDSAYGCFRDFTIRDLGVRKYLRNSNDYVEFTPTQPGTYTFACSMGMGLGKLIVS